ncbi:MAG: hypothetical protein ACRDGI_11065, partial [Candidatus Limnocylindrales bacterium]
VPPLATSAGDTGTSDRLGRAAYSQSPMPAIRSTVIRITYPAGGSDWGRAVPRMPCPGALLPVYYSS